MAQQEYLLSPSAHPRYDLCDAEIDDLTESLRFRYREFIRSLEQIGAVYGCIAVDGKDPLADLGRTLEQRVFDDEAGDHNVEMMEREFWDYEERSIFFLGYDLRTGYANGSIRAITGNVGFGPMVKTMRDCLSIKEYQVSHDGLLDQVIDLSEASPLIDLELGYLGGHRNPVGQRLDRRFLESFHSMKPGESIFDMASVVVPKSARTDEAQRMSSMLYGCSFRGAHALNVSHAVTFIREDLLGVFREHLQMKWKDLGGLPSTRYVAGDPFNSQPAYADLVAFRHQFAQALAEADREPIGTGDDLFSDFVRLMVSPARDRLFLLT